jgi:hypothetical protein
MYAGEISQANCGRSLHPSPMATPTRPTDASVAGEGQEALLAQLGPHRMTKACLYLKRLADVDEGVLETLVRHSVAAVRAAYPV